MLSIGTRPDCLPDDVLELLGELNKIKPIWVELGLQCVKEETVSYIRRAYENRIYEDAVRALHEKGIYVITHIILGLPGEELSDMKKTLLFALENKTDGLKLQLLHVLSDSALYKDFTEGRFSVLTKEQYLHILKELIPLIPEDVAVHRLTGDGNKKTLVAPLWSADKKDVLNSVNKMLSQLEEEKDFLFRPINFHEIPLMFDIIISRMKWMDEVGIKQWNVTEYDKVYPVSYYEEMYRLGQVFVLERKSTGQIVAAAVLKHEDDRWEHLGSLYEQHSAFYLHNFATVIGEKGVGAVFLRLAEDFAAKEGKEFFRLDSADDNERLEKYYSEKGYSPVGYCIDGRYTGILRQKLLNRP